MQSEAAACQVKFSVLALTDFGSKVVVVGSEEVLGNWQADHGVELQTSSTTYPLWSNTVQLKSARVEEEVNFKYVIISPSKQIEWERGPNRRFVCRSSGVVETPSAQFGIPVHLPAAKADSSSDQVEVQIEAVCRNTRPGEKVVVVGSSESLGAWNPSNGIVLTTSPQHFPRWLGKLRLPMPTFDTRWKLVIIGNYGEFLWETCADRRSCISSTGDGSKWKIRAEFDGSSEECQDPLERPLQTPTKNKPMEAKEKHIEERSPESDDGTPPRIPTYQSSPVLLRCASETTLCLPRSFSQKLDRRSAVSSEGQLVLLRIDQLRPKDLCSESVEVVFPHHNNVTCKLRLHEAEESWQLPFAESGLAAGVYGFYFLVAGQRILSNEFCQHGNLNVAIFSEHLQRYLLTHTPATETDAQAGAEDLNLRSRSVTMLGGLELLEEEDVPKRRQAPLDFKASTLQGLFGIELRLRLDGFALTDLSETMRPGCRLLPGAHRLGKRIGECEDAFFIDSYSLGVSDGVGCMAEFKHYGMNTPAFAAELMDLAAAYLARGDFGEADRRAKNACITAADTVQSYGAATISVLALEGSTCGVANLGDSGFMLLRKGPHGMTIVERSKEQVHSWNTPFQLTRLPRELSTTVGNQVRLDRASDCDLYSFTVCEGDLVILHTDGLCDNLYDEEILHIVDRALSPALADLAGVPDLATAPDVLARALAAAAQERSLDITAKVPFNQIARQHGQSFSGGKEDDITVVAAWVLAEDYPPHDNASLDSTSLQLSDVQVDDASRTSSASAEQQCDMQGVSETQVIAENSHTNHNASLDSTGLQLSDVEVDDASRTSSASAEQQCGLQGFSETQGTICGTDPQRLWHTTSQVGG